MDADPILAQIDTPFAEWGIAPEAIPNWEGFRQLGSATIAQRRACAPSPR